MIIVMRICMISTNHDIFDDRIYWKQALSLKKNGYEVICVGISNIDDSGMTSNGIKYILIKPENKKFNLVVTTNLFYSETFGMETYNKLFNIVSDLKCDVYHFHDLYINIIGKKLKNMPHKPKVIYDVHECYPEEIRDYKKTKGIATLNKLLYSYYIDKWELLCSQHYDYIITVERSIKERFARAVGQDKVDIIYNYTNFKVNYDQIKCKKKVYDVIYCGGISKIRGAMQLLEMVKIARNDNEKFKMLFLGPINSAILRDEMLNYISKNGLEENVILKGKVPFNEVREYYLASKIGIAIFLPSEVFNKSIQIKTFEYMMFGLPIVGSNFGHISEYINEANVGETVDPTSPTMIWDAVNKILSDQELYNTYSKNGNKVASEKYNWDIMEIKLLKIYNSILNN